MASRFFRPSRIIAVVLALGAAAWIVSGRLSPQAEEETPSAAEQATPAVPVQKVSVTAATPEDHQRVVVLSCVTQADHRAQAVARGAGVIISLSVTRGASVKAGQVIATISDEGREANVAQAKALLDQRQSEYNNNKRLIDRGDAPRNDLAGLESAVAAARAALAGAQAEADRSAVHAPIDGVVDTVPVQIGQAVQIGMEIAEIVDPNPMLAVGAVSEARRGELEKGQPAEVRFIDGRTAAAMVRFVGLSADKATRTYPVEAEMNNADGLTADGVTCEMTVKLKPMQAASVPRSALVFSDTGELGVRVADANNKVKFLPVSLVDDNRQEVWVTGIDAPTRVIVVGQDFVKDGDLVEAVSPAETTVKQTVPPA